MLICAIIGATILISLAAMLLFGNAKMQAFAAYTASVGRGFVVWLGVFLLVFGLCHIGISHLRENMPKWPTTTNVLCTIVASFLAFLLLVKEEELSKMQIYVAGDLFVPPTPEWRTSLENISGGWRVELPQWLLEYRAAPADEGLLPCVANNVYTKDITDPEDPTKTLRGSSVKVKVLTKVRYRIIDATKYAPIQGTFPEIFEAEVAASVGIIAGREFDLFRMMTDREGFASALETELQTGHGTTLNRWGIEALEAYIESIETSSEIQKSMEGVASAILAAQSLAQKQVLRERFLNHAVNVLHASPEIALNSAASVLDGTPRETFGIDGVSGDTAAFFAAMAAASKFWKASGGPKTGGKPPKSGKTTT